MGYGDGLFGLFHTALVHINHVFLRLIAIAPEHYLCWGALLEQTQGAGKNNNREDNNMPVRMAVPKETVSGERRVALDPTMAERFAKLGVEILMEKGAGLSAFFTDDAYGKSSRLIVYSAHVYFEE